MAAGAGEGDLVVAHVFGVFGEEAVAVEGVEAVASLGFGESFFPHGGDEEVEDADACGAGAEHGDFLLGEGDSGGVDGGEEGGGGDGRGALDVVVEGAEAVAVALEEAGCVDAGKVFPLEEDVGPAVLDGFDEGFDEGVVLGTADAMVLPADVDGVGEEGFVVGADVEEDGEAVFGGDAAEGGIEGHFADGDAHAAGALVAEAEDAFAVGDDDAADLIELGVVEHFVHAVAVEIADEEAAGATPDFREALAAFADGGGVDDGEHGLNVVGDEGVEEGFVGVLEVAHVGVFAECVFAAVEDAEAAVALVGEGADVGREEAVEVELVALFFGEGGALVEAGIEEEIGAGEAGADGLFGGGCGSGGCWAQGSHSWVPQGGEMGWRGRGLGASQGRNPSKEQVDFRIWAGEGDVTGDTGGCGVAQGAEMPARVRCWGDGCGW